VRGLVRRVASVDAALRPLRLVALAARRSTSPVVFATGEEGRPNLVPLDPRVAVAVEGLVAEGRLGGAGALQVEAGVVGVGHADAAVHLHHLVGDEVQGVADLGLRQRDQLRHVRAVVVDRGQRRLDAGAGQFEVGEHLGRAVLQRLERPDHLAELDAGLEVVERDVERLQRRPEHLGGKVQLYAKREDCNSGLAFGGNKLRKLEYIIPDAIASNADTLVSIGGVQSNHTRMVAAVAAKLGMKCRLIQESWVPHEDAVYDRVGNIMLSRIMGAEVQLVDEGFDIGIRESWLAALEDVKAEGGKPYAIPAGASVHKFGGLGYVGFAEEVRMQEKQMGVKFDFIIVCTVTGSTHAGMVVGFGADGRERQVIGIDASFTPAQTKGQVLEIARNTAGLVGGILASVVAFSPSFAFILLGAHRFDQIRSNRTARAFLSGAGPAAIGAIYGSAIPLTRALSHPWQYAVLAGALLLLLPLRRGVVLTLLSAGAVGVVIALAVSTALS